MGDIIHRGTQPDRVLYCLLRERERKRDREKEIERWIQIDKDR